VIWLRNLDEDAMTLEIFEGLRAFHFGRDWFAAYRLRPVKHAYDLIQRVWCALERSRERTRLRGTLHRLSDWELQDIGICRGEIERIVSSDGQAVRGYTTGSTSIERPEPCDTSVQHRPF
jgi:uncharacterized protein YjiS (DUF1127 family)